MRFTRFRTAALIALIAFALNVIVPFFAVYNVSGTDAKHLASAFGERILICSGNGFTWVKVADLASGREKPVHSGDKCPLCYAASHGFTSLVLATTATLPQMRLHASSVAHAWLLLSFEHAAFSRVRAPPASFIG